MILLNLELTVCQQNHDNGTTRCKISDCDDKKKTLWKTYLWKKTKLFHVSQKQLDQQFDYRREKCKWMETSTNALQTNNNGLPLASFCQENVSISICLFLRHWLSHVSWQTAKTRESLQKEEKRLVFESIMTAAFPHLLCLYKFGKGCPS